MLFETYNGETQHRVTSISNSPGGPLSSCLARTIHSLIMNSDALKILKLERAVLKEEASAQLSSQPLSFPTFELLTKVRQEPQMTGALIPVSATITVVVQVPLLRRTPGLWSVHRALGDCSGRSASQIQPQPH